MPVTHLTTYDDLLQYLREHQVPHREDPAVQVVEIPVTTQPLRGILYVRWEKELPYVQLIFPIVLDVPAARLHDVETAICRANNVIALPGLGFEYQRNFVYMRLCVPMYEEGVLASSFQRQVGAVIKNAGDFAGPFGEIVAGKPGKQVMELAMKYATDGAAGPPADA